MNQQKIKAKGWLSEFRMPLLTVPVSFFLVEAFAFGFLMSTEDRSAWESLRAIGSEEAFDLWPLAFGCVWAVLMTGIVRLLPRTAGRIFYGVTYFLAVAYAAVQSGYYHLFNAMMWMSEFRYASEGSEFFNVLLKYPIGWWLGILGLLLLGALTVWKFPRRKAQPVRNVIAGIVAAAAVFTAVTLPEAVFLHDRQIQYAGSDYGRAQSARAAYENMFNTHRLYQVCGMYQTMVKDFYANTIYPLTPGYAHAKRSAKARIDSYFEARGESDPNDMTGIFAGKNVVLVLMESMDDWAIGEHTPTINRLMAEGINFTDFYAPPYGGVRTFNSEFCLNTGTFLSSAGGYAFDYVTNDFRQSIAGQLTDAGYSAKVYHYNSPNFYSRGVFSPAMGYDEYVCYEDYVTEENKRDLYDDNFLFDNAQINADFFRDGQKLNFIITRSAHLSYIYNEVLSYWGLQKYPYFRGLTGHEEEDCMYLKAKLVDDMFARLMEELEAKGELENTVIIAMTDHYTYGVKDEKLVLDRSGVDDMLLVEKVPFFIWSADGPAMEVDKTLNTSDVLPTVLNLMGIDSPYYHMGQDAFDENYEGYALFSNGSWICCDAAYNAATGELMQLNGSEPVSPEFISLMGHRVNDFIYYNNLILESDYYAQ